MIEQIRLEQLHPAARLVVMTDVNHCESGFTNGASLREHWESGKVQRVSPDFHQWPDGYIRCLCPDARVALIKFTSDRCQLLAEFAELSVGLEHQYMPKHEAPRKKGATKPVRPAAGSQTTTAKPKKPKTEGNYKWLLQRLKSQSLDALSKPENRGTIREGLKVAEKFTDVRAFFERAEIGKDKFDAFLDEFFDASINR